MTQHCEIWITQADHEQLMEHLYPGDHDEHGGVLRAGIVRGERGLRLLVQHVALADEKNDYGPGKFGYRALKPTFIHQQITSCRDQHLAYLAVHNHDCDRTVAFSRIDMESHERGYPALLDIGKGVPVGALVFGRRSVEADVWLPDGSRLRLGEMRVIGPSLKRYHSRPRAYDHTATGSDDRQLRMFGATGQAMLGTAKVAIIGVGGVGSLVSEYAARLGVGELLLIDPDRVEESNLSRVVGATSKDVKTGCFKTHIAERVAREARPSITLETIEGDVALCSVAERLIDCDYIFLCADSMRARLVTNAVAHQYFIPMVQLGAKVRNGQNGALEDAMSAVRHVRPGDGCLWCNGFIDGKELALEAKSDAERKAQAYGVQEPNPSVITLNAVAAAHGINDFLFDYLGLRQHDDEARFGHHHFLTRQLKRVVPRKEPDCGECVRRFGMGQALPLPCTSA